MKKLFTIKQFAEHFGISPRTVLNNWKSWVVRYGINPLKINSMVRFTQEDIETLEKAWLVVQPSGKRKTLAAALALSLLLIGNAFAETGLASWYTVASTKAEGNSGICANGERMNDKALTCALRQRSFGKFYRVTNRENGKSVIVRHNDFGPGRKPAARGVIIDLSRSAFEQIADTWKGLVRVEVEEVRG